MTIRGRGTTSYTIYPIIYFLIPSQTSSFHLPFLALEVLLERKKVLTHTQNKLCMRRRGQSFVLMIFYLQKEIISCLRGKTPKSQKVVLPVVLSLKPKVLESKKLSLRLHQLSQKNSKNLNSLNKITILLKGNQVLKFIGS